MSYSYRGRKCTPGNGTCGSAKMVKGKETDIHDKNLMEATTKINAILDGIPNDPHGRYLRFLNVKVGVFLAWMEHSDTREIEGVTIHDDIEAIANEFDLVLEESDKPGLLAYDYRGRKCTTGNGSCSKARLVKANESGIHDKNLMEATTQINKILDGIPSDSGGRNLSFLNVNRGAYLAWMEHEEQVTINDDFNTIADEFDLILETASGA